MSTSIDISTNEIEVIPSDSVVVETNQKDVCVQPYTDIEVVGVTKEYAIIGDAIFASQNIGEAPQWLTSIIDSVIGTALDSSLTDLAQAQRDLVRALEELGIANNNYTEMVNIDTRVDSAISTRLAALNANIENANATIAELQITKVSATEALAIALDVVSSSLNDTSAGTIGGTVSQLNSSISTLAGNVSSARTLVESRYGELNEAIADLEISVNTSIDGVSSNFVYNSTLKVGDKYYKTGFGLKADATTGGKGTVVDPFTSEFWIDATRFKFTNSNTTGSVTPFTIDAEGDTPKISFNGTVSFNNITGDDKPEPGATRNEFRGAWTSGAVYRKGDVVTDNGNSWGAKLDHTATSGNKPPTLSTGLSTTWALNAAKGDQGFSGVDARSVSVTASDQTIEYDSAGNTPNPSTVVLTATSTNTTGSVYYEFIIDGVSKQNTTSNTYTYTLPTSYEDMPIKVEVALREDDDTSHVLAGDVTTIVGLKKGSDGITVILSNEAHVVPANNAGSVLSLAGSGTTIEVWQGTTQLSYGTTGNGTYSVTAVGTSVTVGNATTSGNLRVYSDISAFSANTGKIDFTITVRGVDGITRTITKRQVFAKSLQGLQGVPGAVGANGAAGSNARKVDLIGDVSAIAYNSDGARVTNSVNFTAFAGNITGIPFYEFFVNDVSQGTSSSTNTFTYVPPTTFAEPPISVEVEVREASSSGTIVARDEVTLVRVKAGSDAISATLSNEAHVLVADSSGTVSSYAGSGTSISVFQGATKLQYETGTGSPTTNGKFRVAVTATGITAGGVTVSATDALVANASNMTADVATLVYTINIRNSNGVASTITKTQSFSKSKTGAKGANGPTGQSTVTIYRNVTAKPSTPATGGIPSGWYTYVPTTWTGNVWRSEGTAAAGSSDFVWGEPYLDFTSWRAPSKTTIDGAYIETGTITADQIRANTITGDKINVDTLTVKKLQANTVANPVGMVVDTVNGYIKVYDDRGNLRVQVGNLSV